jgi:ribonuclease BN (tRNA processing enzyme)
LNPRKYRAAFSASDSEGRPMQVQFVGSGDAFGSGGRSNTCFHLRGATVSALIDCGASSLPALKRCGIDRNAIDTILITHFHGDHFAGVPFFMLDAHFVSRRERPLTIAGPPGMPDWYARISDATYPGATGNKLRFPLTLHEVAPERTDTIGAMRVTPFHVSHDDRAGPCLAYRIETEGRTITYSGDTGWTETLVPAARDADLFICECYLRDKPVRSHLSLVELQRELPGIGAKRVILTHMSDDMLTHLDSIPYETAADGMIVEV